MPLELKFTGASWESKVDLCREEMKHKSVDALVLSALDDVAYLFNLRGSDIKFNPVFFAYAVVTQTTVI